MFRRRRDVFLPPNKRLRRLTGAFRRSGAALVGRLGLRQERRESGSFLVLTLSWWSFEERRDIKGPKTSSTLDSEGTVPCGASTLPRHVLPLAPPFGFSISPHLNAPAASSPPSRRHALRWLGSSAAAADNGGLHGRVMEPRREGGALTECQRGALMEAAAGRWRGSRAEGQRFPESSPDVCEVKSLRKKSGRRSAADPRLIIL